MPFKFWKKEKKEEKGEAPEAKTEPKVPEAAVPAETKAEATSEPAPAPATEPAPADAPKPVAPPAAPQDVDAVVAQAHAGLVDLGLTIPATKAVFGKRAAGFPGGAPAFVEAFRATPYRATTQLLVDWLGFRAPLDFEPEAFLKDINLRLSSFKLAIRMTDLTWLDQELSLRKARLSLDGQEKVVRFKDARDFMKGIDELLASKKIAFVELETWSSTFAFMLVRDPRWDKLASTDLVVVKAAQTAVGGECGECGAPVGPYWHDCLSCGAVFGTD